ncbi:MAG TPA: YncE family protein [Chloroflexota bacterium]|nr:YncE family protein [Chloroflexota bacterium]
MGTVQGRTQERGRTGAEEHGVRRRMLLPVALLAVTMVLILTAASWQTAVPPLRLHTVADVPLAGGSSRLDYQSLDPTTGLLFIAHLGASMVHVVDTTTNRVVRDIPAVAGVHGILAIPALKRVYASATDDDQVDAIDARTFRVVARIPGGGYPDGIAYDPIHQRVFVSDEGGATDTVIDTRTERRITTIPLGGEAGNTQYDPVSRRMFVDVQTLNQLVAMDPVTNHVSARYPLPGCDHDHSLLIDAPRRLAFVACDGNATLLVVDMRSMTVIATYSVGPEPDVLAFDPGWRRLYVACESGIISVFDEHGRTVRKVAEGFVATEAHTIAVDPRTHHLYLPLEDIGGKPVLRVALPPTHPA